MDKVNGYEFTLDDKMVKLIEQGLVQVVAYKDDGHIPARPFVEIQTDLEKTEISYSEFVDKFNSYEEANMCVRAIAEHLNIPSRAIPIN